MKSFIVLFVFLFISGFALNANSTATEPQMLVEEVAAKTIKRLKKDTLLIDNDPKHINKVINELLIPHFDFERMARWVLGKHWRKAKPDQRITFVEEFKSLLIRTYASSLREYSEQPIIYSPFRGELKSGDVTVRSEIAQPGGFPIPINYKLYFKSDRWLVYDIAIDDVSLVTNYRSSFSRQIKKDGLEKLIEKMASKN